MMDDTGYIIVGSMIIMGFGGGSGFGKLPGFISAYPVYVFLN